MKSRVEEAVERKSNGYNCAQAVACSYCDLVGLDEETMFKITEGFGAGMGNMEGTCGAITGACALAGMAKRTADENSSIKETPTRKISASIMREFMNKNKSVICKELKGVDTGKVLRSCPDCVRDASELLEKIVFNDK